MCKIPRKIHYIWFGKGPKSELILKCIESWKKFLPDWEFIEWNESNYDITKSPYIKEAYESKKYAFAADYARFDILYKYGGIYFDTDVELLKPIPEEFLNYAGFTGVEGNKKIAPGLVFAAQPQNKILKEIKDFYDREHFILDNKMNMHTVVEYTTAIFREHGFIENGKMQYIDNFVIFPVEYFCAYDFDIREFNITDKTISIHHYTFAWGNMYKKTLIKLKMVLKKIVGINNYKKILKIKRKFFGIRGEKNVKKIMDKLRGEPNLDKLKKIGLKVGENFTYGRYCFFDPSHCFLISIANNLTFSTRLHLLAHDASTKKIIGYAKIGLVKIKDNAFIGANVTILPGVTIGENSIVGAGSVVSKSIPDNVVACGNPVKVICSIDEYKLKFETNVKFEEEYTLRGKITNMKKQEMIQKLEGGKIGLVR